jgi:hypothetical protein
MSFATATPSRPLRLAVQCRLLCGSTGIPYGMTNPAPFSTLSILLVQLVVL